MVRQYQEEGEIIRHGSNPTELADQLVEEIGEISGGKRYGVWREEMGASQAEEPQKEEHGGRSIIRGFEGNPTF